MKLARRCVGVLMLVIGLAIGVIGMGILLVAVLSGAKSTALIDAPLCLALVGASGMWLYFGRRLL